MKQHYYEEISQPGRYKLSWELAREGPDSSRPGWKKLSKTILFFQHQHHYSDDDNDDDDDDHIGIVKTLKWHIKEKPLTETKNKINLLREDESHVKSNIK